MATPDQIVALDFHTRPTKKADSRAKKFEGDSVEVDAVAPDMLRSICEQCVVAHIDDDASSGCWSPKTRNAKHSPM